MDTSLPAEVTAFALAAAHRFRDLGGADLARAAELDPAARGRAGAALAGLGADDLDVRADLEQLLAGAVLSRAAGGVALPWPLAADLLRRDGERLALIDPTTVRVDHGDLGGDWVGTDLHGQAWRLDVGERSAGRLGPFLTRATLGAAATPVSSADIARHLTLGAWSVLGALETSVAQVSQHLRDRRQFGQPLSEFQAIRFSVADATVSVRGLEELAKFTVWRLGADAGSAASPVGMADALALRLYAADTARTVFRTCHQLYGALGFCDETDLSMLDRHTQPLLRHPQSAERMAELLVGSERASLLTSLG